MSIARLVLMRVEEWASIRGSVMLPRVMHFCYAVSTEERLGA